MAGVLAQLETDLELMWADYGGNCLKHVGFNMKPATAVQFWVCWYMAQIWCLVWVLRVVFLFFFPLSKAWRSYLRALQGHANAWCKLAASSFLMCFLFPRGPVSSVQQSGSRSALCSAHIPACSLLLSLTCPVCRCWGQDRRTVLIVAVYEPEVPRCFCGSFYGVVKVAFL